MHFSCILSSGILTLYYTRVYGGRGRACMHAACTRARVRTCLGGAALKIMRKSMRARAQIFMKLGHDSKRKHLHCLLHRTCIPSKTERKLYTMSSTEGNKASSKSDSSPEPKDPAQPVDPKKVCQDSDATLIDQS